MELIIATSIIVILIMVIGYLYYKYVEYYKLFLVAKKSLQECKAKLKPEDPDVEIMPIDN